MKHNALLYFFRKLGILLIALLPFASASAQTDKEFWFSIPEINRYHVGGDDSKHETKGGPVFLRLTTGNLPSKVTISMPANSANFNGGLPYVVNIPANKTETLNLQTLGFVGDDNFTPSGPVSDPFGDHSLTSMENRLLWTTSNVVGVKKYINKNNKGILITATTPITAYYQISSDANMDLLSLKGKNALGKDFFVPFQTDYSITNSYSFTYRPYSSFDIVATEDNTEIEITPTQDVFTYPGGSLVKNKAFRIWLNKGETAIIPPYDGGAGGKYKTSYSNRLSGSQVKVVGGGNIAIITRDDMVKSPTSGNVDFVGDQIVPVDFIGMDYAVVRGQLGNNVEHVYVVVTQTGTTVEVNGVPQGLFNTRQTVAIPVPSGNLMTRIHADKPVYVYHLSGFTFKGTQTQFAGAIIPTISVCTGSSQVAFNRTKDGAYGFYLNILVRKGAETKFKVLDKNKKDTTVLVPGLNLSASYKPVGATPPYSDWLYASFAAPDIVSGDDEAYLISNSEDVFHLGVLNGYGGSDAFYGYFSDFNAFNPSTFVVETQSPGAKQCKGVTLQLYASGGTKYQWDPITYLDDPTSANPKAVNIQASVPYAVTVSGACGLKKTINVPILIGDVTPQFVLDQTAGCAPLKVKVTNTSLGAVVSSKWDLNKDGKFDGANEGENNNTDFFLPFDNTTNNVAYQNITLVASDGVCTKEYSQKVLVYPNVIAQYNLTQADIKGCHPLSVDFASKCKGNTDEAKYHWDFGDGGAAVGSTVKHVYTNYDADPKTIRAKLTITDKYNYCSDTVSVPVKVQPYIKASFVVDTIEHCSPLNVKVTDDSKGGIFQRFWDYEGDKTYVLGPATPWTRSFSHSNTLATNSKADSVLVGLYVSNSGGCTDTLIQKVKIYPQPKAAIVTMNDNGNTLKCSPLAMNFTGSYTGSDPSISTTHWLIENTAIDNVLNANYTFNNFGASPSDSRVWFAVTNKFGCVDTVKNKVTVQPFVKAEFTLDKQTGCSPLTVAAKNISSLGSSSFVWDLQNNGSVDFTTKDITIPPIVNLNTNLTTYAYPIKLTASNAAGCTNSIVRDVVVSPTPTASFSYDKEGEPFHCAPFTASFNSTTTNTSPDGYVWTFGSFGSSYNEDPFFTFENPGGSNITVPVTLAVKNDFGCSAAPVIKNIVIAPDVVANFTLDRYSGCNSFPVVAKALTVPGATYTWNFDGATVSGQNQTFTIPANTTGKDAFGYHNISLTVANGCTKTSMPRQVLAFPVIAAEMFSDKASGCHPLDISFVGSKSYYLGTNDPVANVIWNFGDNTSSSLQVPDVHRYVNAGVEAAQPYTTTLVATSKDGCVATATPLNVSVFPASIAAFNVSVVEKCTPMKVRVLDASLTQKTGLGTTYTWGLDGGVGTTSSDFILEYGNPDPENPLAKTITLDLTNSFGCKSNHVSYALSVDPQVKAAVYAPIDKVCAPGDLAFNNNSTGGNLNFLWNFGDGATLYASDRLSKSHHYENKGATTLARTVTLTATNAKGCSNAASTTVSVNPAVLASFSADIEKACDPFTSKFVNLTPSSAYKYSWVIDGAVEGAAKDFTRYFENKSNLPVTQSHTVVLNVEAIDNAACKASASKTITVYPRVYPDFSMPDNGCHPFTTSFTNKTVAEGTGTTYLWMLGNGMFSTDVMPQNIKYINEGYTVDKDYSVKLRAISSNGCADSISKKVTVHPVPKVEFKLDGPNAGCAPWPISATNTSVGTNLVYDFDYGVGAVVTNAGAGPYKRDYDNNGSDVADYILKLRGTTQYGCKDSLSQTVFAYPHVKANYVFNPGDKACNPFTVDMVNQSQNTHFYTWTFDDGQGSALDNPKHLFENKDITDRVFNVKLRSESTFGCWDTISHPLTVYAAPVADFQPVPPLQIYPNATFGLENKTFPAAPNWTYRWSLGDGQVRTGKDFNSYTYSKWGPKADGFRYEVILETASAHCKDSVHKFLTLLPAKPIAVFDSDTSAACSPLVVNFYNNSSYAENVLWDFGDGTTSTESEPRHTFTQPGYYNVKLSISGDGGVDNKYGTYRVFKSPVANFKVEPTTVLLPEADAHFFNTSENAVRYQWEFDDAGQTSTEKNPVYRFSSLGSYNVKLTVWTLSEEGSCVDDTTVAAAVRVVGQGTLKYPNAFTPDTYGSSGGAYDDIDTQNKVFHPVWEGVDSYVLRIFNRWGEQIFESHDVKVGWDGFYKGKLSDPDVYVWKAEGTFTNGKTFSKMGDVTLIR